MRFSVPQTVVKNSCRPPTPAVSSRLQVGEVARAASSSVTVMGRSASGTCSRSFIATPASAASSRATGIRTTNLASLRCFSGASAAASSSFDIFAKLKDGTSSDETKGNKLKRKPSDRVLNLADQIMSLTLIEAADLCDICQERLTPGDGSPIPGRMPFPHPMAMFGSGMMMPQQGGMIPQPQQPAQQQPQIQPAGGASESGGAEAAAEPEKEEPKKKAGPVTLKLISFDQPKKISVIKEVRALTALGLAQSKELVEGCPKVLKKGVPPEDADALIEKFKAVGGVVEIA
ncbi:unnamed protein product [Amoebophrya sp. A120]|nr:unnamed protein product [Amoebophrya sp. A120]|eukprot:GSA120T00020445001.1